MRLSTGKLGGKSGGKKGGKFSDVKSLKSK